MSQGMTLNRVIVNLASAFEEGQVYVALSRATSLEGLKIVGGSEGLAVGAGGNEEETRRRTAVVVGNLKVLYGIIYR
ncbi:hypothetical protein CEP51_015863 [Fusarium floridanum]|uniref:Uncharacterized protein n=1 Tax=Fusarium floridanum TaxID=1325733 RepID=A0A428P1F2_9HYPO|nr:hypothetical protein CEP51_015863 [Fusarium floridanum]